MKTGDEPETDGARISCPECGAQESGYFCRNCGALVRGEDKVLCPRCHGIVPTAEFCPRCGQGLKGVALNLHQLAMAGSDFWVTDSGAPPAAVSHEARPDPWEQGQGLSMTAPEPPDWLRELTRDKAPSDVEERVYPALQPLEAQPVARRHSRFVMLVVLLMGVMLVGLVAVTLFLLARGVL
jgi:predicted nucleic acid-binding Zn ribbon protein